LQGLIGAVILRKVVSVSMNAGIIASLRDLIRYERWYYCKLKGFKLSYTNNTDFSATLRDLN
jgi:hypothetical protein